MMEDWEEGLHAGEEQEPLHSGQEPVCRTAQVTDVAGWRTQKEQDANLQPALKWVVSGQGSWALACHEKTV